MFCRKKDGDSYAATLREAWKNLGERSESAAAAATRADFDPENQTLAISMLGRQAVVRCAGGIVSFDGGGELSLAEKVLVLHHLAFSSGMAPTGRKVAFREIPGCQFYNTTFSAHTIGALVSSFCNDAVSFERACGSLGGTKEAGSGVVMRMQAFPNVPVWLCYWPGDDELPPGAQVLYDSSVSAHLPAEDIAVLGEYVVHGVMEAAGRGGGGCVYEN